MQDVRTGSPGGAVAARSGGSRGLQALQRTGLSRLTGPATADLDAQIAHVRSDNESAIDAKDFEQAAWLRERERQLLADKTARQQQWEAAHPDLASLAEQVQRLRGDVERLRDLLRQHGIEPADNTA